MKEKDAALLPQFRVTPAPELPVGSAEAPGVIISQFNFFHSLTGVLS